MGVHCAAGKVSFGWAEEEESEQVEGGSEREGSGKGVKFRLQ